MRSASEWNFWPKPGAIRVLQRRQKEHEHILLRPLIDANPDLVFVKDTHGKYLMCNHAFEKYVGLPENEIIGHDDLHIFSAPVGNAYRMNDALVMGQKQPRRMEWVSYPDGDLVLMDMLNAPLYDAEHNLVGVFGIGRDVTEHRRLEHRLVTATEERQRAIGQELHDSLGQRLIGMAFLAKIIEQSLAGDRPDLARQATQIVDQASEAAAEVHTLARGLVPVELESNGLMAALSALASRVASTYDIVCEFHATEEVLVFDQAQALNLYRIAQEATNNAIRHGNASVIDISLAHADKMITLTVSDNGQGLNEKPSQATPGSGMGIHIMTYRASLVGGTLTITPGEGGGVCVKAVIPVQPPAFFI